MDPPAMLRFGSKAGPVATDIAEASHVASDSKGPRLPPRGSRTCIGSCHRARESMSVTAFHSCRFTTAFKLCSAAADNPAGSVTKGPVQVAESIKQFILETLQEMNYDVEGIDDDSQLGPSGADVSSLALVELAVRVEDEYGVEFSQDEAEELAGKTVGEFCQIVADRVDTAKTAVG
jgi:acyl carrier protein